MLGFVPQPNLLEIWVFSKTRAVLRQEREVIARLKTAHSDLESAIELAQQESIWT
jgi:hypothetical protein